MCLRMFHLAARPCHQIQSMQPACYCNKQLEKSLIEQASKVMITAVCCSPSGCNLDAADRGGATALMHAVRGGHAAVVAALAEGGAALDAADRKGTTALMVATMGQQHDCLKVSACPTQCEALVQTHPAAQ